MKYGTFRLRSSKKVYPSQRLFATVLCRNTSLHALVWTLMFSEIVTHFRFRCFFKQHGLPNASMLFIIGESLSRVPRKITLFSVFFWESNVYFLLNEFHLGFNNGLIFLLLSIYQGDYIIHFMLYNYFWMRSHVL